MSDKTSNIQKNILEKTKKREEQPKRGVLQNIQEFENDNIEDKIFFNFVNGGARVEIHGKANKEYEVTFVNSKTNETLNSFQTVKSGEWVQAKEEFYISWVINVKDLSDDSIKSYSNNVENKTVFIAFESSALGDTIAWLPIINAFREQNNCTIVCSTFHNYLFQDVYPDITFIDRGVPIQGMQMAFRIGWFGSGHKSNRNPYDCQTRNLQQMCCDILGMKWTSEIRPKLKPKNKAKVIKSKKYVAITTCSTAQFKYWNKEGGWQSVVDYLVKKGYQVVNVGKQPNTLRNVLDFTGKRDMDDLMNVIQKSQFFIGLPSGLSWLSWGLGKKTIMISGISEHFCEFQEDMYRVENLKVCHGCFNKPYEKNEDGSYNTDKPITFDKGKWLWCPFFQNTDRHFECTKTIEPTDVFKKIVMVEKHIKNKISTILDMDGNLTSKSGTIISKYGE